MQAVAAHAHPDGGLESLDQFELQNRRRGRPRARPVDGNAARACGPRQHLADGVNAKRKRHMRAAAAPAARAIVNARKADHGGFDIVKAARIEQRGAGRAARAPIFGNAVIGRQAEVLVEFLVVELAQSVLVEQRNFAPLVRIVEPLGIHVVEFALIERRAACLRERPPLALGLKALDGGARFRKVEKRRHLQSLPRTSRPAHGQEPRGGRWPIQRLCSA